MNRRHPKRAIVAAFALMVAALTPAGAQAVANPKLTGFIADSETLPGATSVAVAGHYAYVTDYYAGRLTAIDISNPAKPAIAGSSAPSNELLNASTVNIAGGHAFVASKNRNGPLGSESNDDGTGNSLTILDIQTNPASPTIVGTVRDANTLFGAYGVAVSGNYAYVASQGCLSGQPCPNHSVGNAFAVIDISNASSPLIVAALHNTSLPSPWKGSGALGHATAVAIAGNYAYVTAAYQDRLTILDISNPLAPKIVASLRDTTNFNFPVDVAVSGQYAYVVAQTSPGRVTVVDVSNPASPQVVASLPASALAGAYRIRLRGDFAYVSASSAADVAAVDISYPLSPRLAGYLPNGTHLHKTTGLDVDPSARYVVANSPYLSTQSQPLYPPYALQPEGPTLTGTVSTITLDPSPISVSIAASSEPENPTAQTTAGFSLLVSDAIAAVQCRLDAGVWAPCTTPAEQTYAGLQAGPHTFEVQATDTAGNTSAAAYGWTLTPPANTAPPSVSGTASVGQELTASPGSWTGSPAFAYQWLRCDSFGTSCLPIEGASSASYIAGSTDAGSTLQVQVTATTSAGSTSTDSAPTSAIAAAPANLVAPAILGTASVGQTLSVSPGSWSGYPAPTIAYQWERCDQTGANCNAIAGATASTYTLAGEDAGTTLAVLEEASNSTGSSQAGSTPTAVVLAAPGSTAPPTISGSATEGQTLTASSGQWSGYPQPSLEYQWEHCNGLGQSCTAIPGAATSSYTVLSADVGATLLVTVTATNSAGSAKESSGATAVVTAAPANQTPPTITGTATTGQTLTANPGTWTGYPTPALAYRWERCNNLGQSCAAIPGATGPTYTLGAQDAASTIAVTEEATNTAGTATAQSNATALVTAAPANQAPPTITGTATEGQTLTANPGTWTGYPTPALEYRWERCNNLGQSCAAIPGASAPNYTVLSADVGSALAVTVTASSTAGQAQASSAATAIVVSAAGPLTPLLDNFARPNNSGPPGPNWTHMAVSSTSANSNLYITGEQVTGKPGSNADYWNPQTYGPNSEVWVTVAVKPNIDLDPVVLGLRFQNPGATNASGYQAYYIYRSSQPDQYKIISRTNGTTSTTLATVNGPTLNPGDQLLFRAIGTTLELWRFDAGSWTRILSATDSTYQTAGYLNLTARDGSVRLTNFGGGTLP